MQLIGEFNQTFEWWNPNVEMLFYIQRSKDRLADGLEDTSLLELVFGEDAVLLGVLVIGLSWNFCLGSVLVLGLGLLLWFSLSTLNVLESLSESVFDGQDLSGGFIQEVINFRLDLRVGLVVIFLKFDLRDSELNLFDEVPESLLGGLLSAVTTDAIDSLGSFLGLLLLCVGSNLLVGNFFGLLLGS